MEALTLGLPLLVAVLASSLIDQIIPRVSLPLIQIVIGLLIAVVAGGEVEVTLDPELFLVMFIAPLLYDEAKHADKQALWRERKPVLSLAIGLVVATTLVIGFLLNAFVPSIPLAAAFALGAALGPTDAVAVSSLSKQVDIPKRQASMLKGELLLNDASGIVSFQFAIAAVVTGSFSLVDAGVDFLVEFVGGLLLGILLGLLGNWVVKRARSIGVENTNFHVLFEVLIPFLIYLVANVCHVSGVIAVVVAGLINVTSPKGVIGPSVSRMNIVSGSVWHVLTYALNGIVFVLLGTQLPLAMQDAWENVRITNSTLILLVFGLTFVLLATRFLWVLAMDLYHVRRDEKRRFGKGDLRSALITTFCGAKGTITLSIMFSIPTYAVYGPPNVPFPQRELLIFLACGVIVCTLLLATFVVPLLAPARDKGEEELRRIDQDAATTMDIMREVIEMLTAQQTRENRAETQAVIRSYNDRLARIKANNGIESEMNVELRVQALMWEYERAMELMERGVRLGADVPYCIMRGTALSEGIGEILTPLPPMPQCRVLIAKPAVSVSTKHVYESLNLPSLGAEAHPDIDAMRAAIEKKDLSGVVSQLGNVLETVTIPENPVIQTLKDKMMEMGADGSLMSGSGPTVFGLFTNQTAAQAAYEELRYGRSQDLAKQVYLTSFYNRKGHADGEQF